MELTVCIRTHAQRVYLAEDLKSICDRAFPLGTSIVMCDNGVSSPLYSEQYIVNLSVIFRDVCTPYILLLEDDIYLAEDALEAVQAAISRGDSHNWYTVDTTSDILDKSAWIPKYGYILPFANHISYSGAILLKTEDLCLYLEKYILNFTEYEVTNFDVTVSAFIVERYGHLHLRPGYFLQRAGVESSIKHPQRGRIHYDPSEVFEYTGPKV